MRYLIDRQEAIDAVHKEFDDCIVWDESGMTTANEVERILDGMSFVARKTGRWIKISPAGIYECSNCGQNVMTSDIDCYSFCHGCGADMRGEKI